MITQNITFPELSLNETTTNFLSGLYIRYTVNVSQIFYREIEFLNCYNLQVLMSQRLLWHYT
jgi:hypothetical protein